uniref:Uncharacterized protein n=1 Tax=Oryza barthii TaxID=65489 RepID=A0A0D3H4K6_9ORYZ
MHHHTTSFSLGGRIQVRVSSWESKSPELLKTITTCTQEEGHDVVFRNAQPSLLSALSKCQQEVNLWAVRFGPKDRDVILAWKNVISSSIHALN